MLDTQRVVIGKRGLINCVKKRMAPVTRFIKFNFDAIIHPEFSIG